MTDRPWMPLYVPDYLADTGHMSTVEHGAYLLLIMHYWQNDGLPTDDKRLARIARLTPDEWEDVRDVIAEHFDSEWHHKRIDKEIAKATDVMNKRRRAGQASAEARKKQDDDVSSTHAEQVNEQSPRPSPSPSPCSSEQEISHVHVNANGKTGFDAEFENDFWPAWRKNRVGDIAAKREFKAARAAGIPLKEIVDGARRYQASKPEWQNWKAPANWLKDGNWADEPSKPDEKTETPASEPREWVNTKDPRWPQLNYPTITTNQYPGQEGNYVRVSDLRGLMPPMPDELKRPRPAA